MHYWNKDNFEGLLAVAESFDGEQSMSALAEYCRLREQGLRKQALSALDKFIKQAMAWSMAETRSVCIKILETNARLPQAHQFFSQPLTHRLLIPTLKQWNAEEPDNHVPMRWLGMMLRLESMLRQALKIDPHDMPVRKMLIDWALGDVDHATHHLGEDLFIGEVSDAEISLSDARKLIEECEDQDSLDYLRKDLEQSESLLADWKEYRIAPNGSFSEWCAEKGRERKFIKAYYYRK